MNLFLILLLLNALFGRRDRLYCGLFGWVGTSLDHFVPLKLKFLGVLNDSRGGDGVGLFNGTGLIKSVTPDEFGKLITTDDISKNFIPTQIPIFLGHTRKRSTGMKDMEHTQPIIEATENGLVSRVFHNGTIHDLTDLIKTANLVKEIPDTFGLSDTQVLTKMLHILREEEISFKVVLENYSGSASLMMSFSDDPGAVYIFRGRLKWSTGSYSVERPLYYVREAGRGYYVSSIEESLKYIADNDEFEEVKEVPENTLIRLIGDREEVVEVMERTYKAKVYPKSNFSRVEYSEDDYTHEGGCGYNVLRQNSKFPKFSDLTDYKTLEALVKVKSGDAVIALDFLNDVYSIESLINRYYAKPEHFTTGKGRVTFYKGRYVLTYRQAIGYNIVSHLADMTLILDEDGYVCFLTQRGAKTYHFSKGMLLKSSLSVSELTEADKCTIGNSFQLGENYIESLEYFMKFVEGPLSIFNRISGTVYTLDDKGVLTKFSGEYHPLFSTKSYTVTEGKVTYARYDALRPSSAPTKSLPPALPPPDADPKTKYIYSTKRELSLEKFKCPSCGSQSLRCIVCKGNGYVTRDVVEEYTERNSGYSRTKSLSITDNTILMFPTPPTKVSEDEETESLVNKEVLEKIHSLSSMITEITGELDVIGETSPLLEKYKLLLEDMQDDLVTLAYA